MKQTLKTNHGFSLLELMVVITIIAILASVSFPTYTTVITRARIMKDVAHQDQIVKACKLYAQDWDGLYPAFDTLGEDSGGESGKFSTSTEAFQELIREVQLGTEIIFFTQGNPEKVRPPNEDGELLPEENCMTYVLGQTDSSPARSPLTADEMQDTGGSFGAGHPWLKSRQAVVGYCGGQVKKEKLTGSTEGATIRGPAGSGITNIFEEAEEDEEGKITGGWLSVGTDNILLP
tara:strand:- start:7093 stop:7794 length:702 start_codon:yes stop_codon:yes gene_type:complete